MKKQILEGIGAINKRETLASVEHDIKENVMAIESQHPFPGYHGQEPGCDDTPISLFLVTKNRHHSEEIIRVTQKTKKNLNFYFDIAPAIINVYNERSYAIRIKDTTYSNIDKIAKAFLENDIPFERKAAIKSYSSLIKLRKFFIIEEISENIYRDKEWDDMFYLKINDMIPWDIFEDFTIDIKNNMEDNNFDAATAMLITRDGLNDFVRIYMETPNLDLLKEIHKRFLEHCKRIPHY
ncbi:MAG: hypothetical protein ACEPOW_01470 [Bacteroidales bacterium]